MPPTPSSPTPARSAALLNDLIRALWMRAGGRLDAGQRAEYEQLVVEWAAAVRVESGQGEVREAA